MTRSTLTEAQAKKVASAVAKFNASQSYSKAQKADSETNAARYADKWARFKLGVRGTGPHGHGFSADQRRALEAQVAAALGIKPEPQKVKKEAAKGKAEGKGKGKTTAQLAKEQKARAEAATDTGSPVEGALMMNSGSGMPD